MTSSFRNYHGSVFSQKKAIWNGIDQSKGLVYRGDQVEMTLNLDNDDNVLKPRDGSRKVDSNIDPINAGATTASGMTVVKGRSVFFASEYGDL